ncbi:hypothetical protein HZH68_012587 [Vespula germanica]|uniref:Uncharacterized protein n=1 Tax=Vespula germanica TaxID=30212 RepID=A0A834JIE7_VESGE|nr:hypothetical protein HZH68_012587 [Vespula germanica]
MEWVVGKVQRRRSLFFTLSGPSESSLIKAGTFGVQQLKSTDFKDRFKCGGSTNYVENLEKKKIEKKRRRKGKVPSTSTPTSTTTTITTITSSSASSRRRRARITEVEAFGLGFEKVQQQPA